MQCATHPSAPGLRQCSRCRRGWCGLCIKQLSVAGKLLEMCPKCNAPLVEPSSTVERPELDPAELARRPFSTDGLITAVALALPLLMSGFVAWIPGMGWFVTLMNAIYYSSLVGYYFQIIAHVGDARPGLPGSGDLLDDPMSLLRLAVRGWVCVAIAAIPYWCVVIFGHHAPGPLATLGLFALGLGYVPAALVSVVLSSSTLGALYPVMWIQVMVRAPASYARLVGLFLGTLVLFALLHRLGNALLIVPVAGAFLGAVLVDLLWFVQACLVGGFLRRHASDFGYA